MKGSHSGNPETRNHLCGGCSRLQGHAEKTESHVLEALRLSPRDTVAHSWMLVAGAAKPYLGRDQEAAAWLRRAVETNRNYPLAHFFLASTLAHLGQMSGARAR